MQDTYRIQTLEQVRILSDPLKLRIIQVLTEKERTAKEIADRLGENVTRLYRHVDALCEAGLIEVAKETRKRGTVERTFRSVARRFEADHTLFANDDDKKSAIRNLLRAGEEELIRALDCGDDEIPIFLRLHLKGSPDELRKLRQQLVEWIESAQGHGDGEPGKDAEEAGALIAFYPIRVTV